MYKKYKSYRDLINHLIRKSKKSHYAAYFDKFQKTVNSFGLEVMKYLTLIRTIIIIIGNIVC